MSQVYLNILKKNFKSVYDQLFEGSITVKGNVYCNEIIPKVPISSGGSVVSFRNLSLNAPISSLTVNGRVVIWQLSQEGATNYINYNSTTGIISVTTSGYYKVHCSATIRLFNDLELQTGIRFMQDTTKLLEAIDQLCSSDSGDRQSNSCISGIIYLTSGINYHFLAFSKTGGNATMDICSHAYLEFVE
jgi:hypothetical protein